MASAITTSPSGEIILDGRRTGFILYQMGTATTVFHNRSGAALSLPSRHYDLGSGSSPSLPDWNNFEREFREALAQYEQDTHGKTTS